MDGPEGIGRRLREAIPEGGIREFHRQMKAKGVRGSSYAMVHQYLSGEAVPPLEFLEAAADVLGYRAAWLAFNVGQPTPEEERRARAEATAGAELLEDVQEGIAEGFGPGADRLLEEGVRLVLVLHTWRRLVTSAAGEALLEAGEAEELPRRIGEALRAPLDRLDVDPEALPDGALTEYVAATCQGLRALATRAPPSPSIADQDQQDET